MDEAHRLKNNNSKSLDAIRNLSYDHLLLLTGTPLQNNTGELWTLLNLIDSKKFPSLETFMEQFGDLQNAQEVKASRPGAFLTAVVVQVGDLHNLLKPLLLRRMKEHVDKSIAAKEETSNVCCSRARVVCCSLAVALSQQLSLSS